VEKQGKIRDLPLLSWPPTELKCKIDSALLPKWKNNIKEVIKIPKGTELGFLIAIFTAIVPYWKSLLSESIIFQKFYMLSMEAG
jgi:hypothetical protein